jgi:murein DD-endopeptidase MepM/ murein hydrolase activator NlpD
MAKKMLIDATHAEETRVVVADGNKVDEFDFESLNKRQLAGNIYLAKVTRVEPSLQAAFVDYGGNRHGFLAFSEVHPDYYQIPKADREALLAEERELAAEAEADEEEKSAPKRRRSRRRKSSDARAEAAAGDAIATGEVSTPLGMDVIDLDAERNERIFTQIEDAVAMSLEPLDAMFRAAGLPTDSILETVRRGYSGQGGPLTPITFSTFNGQPDPVSLRANEVLEDLDAVNLYRIAAESLPFSYPVQGAARRTSGYGYRNDPIQGGRRMHEGQDFAGPVGTPIVAAADGTVVFAGRRGAYGNMIEIRHAMGYTTRYAHLSRIRVTRGERVSRGDRIGDMGNTGRSTGSHLHYEVLQNGNPTNPMTFITAGRNVF